MFLRYRHFFVIGTLLLVSVLGTALPFFKMDQMLGGAPLQVMPELVADSLYYYAQMREVKDGYPQVGNPYFEEGKEMIAPAFFIPVDIGAIPLILGFSLTTTVAFNLFLWGTLFVFLVYALLRRFGIGRMVSVLGALAAYVSCYMFLARPVAMQMVFPLFLVFLLVYLKWIESKDTRTSVTLALVTALTPYCYTYLAYIVLFTLLITFVVEVVLREWKVVRQLFLIGCGSALLALPFIVLVFIPQILHPLYGETAVRIGLVHTRIPALEAFYYGRWILIVLIAWTCVTRVWKRGGQNESQTTITFFLILTGAGLLVSLFSNTITGTDLTIAIHVGRFVILWLSLAVVVLGVELWKQRRFSVTFGIALVCTLLVVVGLVRNIPRSFAPLSASALSTVEAVQAYASPLLWLEKNAPEGSVVWSNDALAEYIPIYTGSYTFFAPAGVLQLHSSEDVIDRYLLSRLHPVTLDSLRADLLLYAGAGKAKEVVRVRHLEALFCRVLGIVRTKPCPEDADAVSLAGTAFFENILDRNAGIQKNKNNLLSHYQVAYFLRDTLNDPPLPPSILRTTQVAYQDNRFIIYQFMNKK